MYDDAAMIYKTIKINNRKNVICPYDLDGTVCFAAAFVIVDYFGRCRCQHCHRHHHCC